MSGVLIPVLVLAAAALCLGAFLWSARRKAARPPLPESHEEASAALADSTRLRVKLEKESGETVAKGWLRVYEGGAGQAPPDEGGNGR